MTTYRTTDPMDLIRVRLRSIADHARDYERAHDEEDALHRATLKAIAMGEFATLDDARAAARLALTSEAIDFPRYCA
jgi:hypothetical protein